MKKNQVMKKCRNANYPLKSCITFFSGLIYVHRRHLIETYEQECSSMISKCVLLDALLLKDSMQDKMMLLFHQ